MSLADGMAAMNLEMPGRVPRTEYSAESHWDLVRRVTGISVDHASPSEARSAASNAFVKAWNYDFVWNILTNSAAFNGFYTKMGHAEYASGGTDFDSQVGCPFDSPEDVLRFDPMEQYGRIDLKAEAKKFGDDCKNQRQRYPDAVTMTGVYITLMSGLIDIFGWDMLLMAAGTDEKAFGGVANRYADWILQYFEALADSDAPTVMVHDDIVWTSGAFLNPAWYREFIFPNYKRLFAPLRESGKKIIYTSDGNFTEFIDDVVASGVHGLVMEPTTDMARVAEKYGKTHVFVGNADTRILLSGTKDDIRNEVRRCMDIGKKCPGFFMAVGNHIPANTPVENALCYNEAYEDLSRR
ncbi:MAG: uroporphyrinogen decarboxylase family protein [Clostridiales bacterium]|jgi:uroporphyrinogen-III decarboxylase|nr:uroporphyrinogen decarboxylase family protein [Clostridiales bacterium]